ncbi:hypothetical protein PENTCL1PPCAC_6097 [Pristionchus entomophagus]|uniref:Reverse transcriptase domain-containing protein n=1 Tax=Pristionchus entomophagus TaxID=358040 RepID=A0AAV5SKQ6_9BILA|nr:hypothetical protein PENTCL1PPCAC_6097 [Pristionchus entomophagus]
MTQYVDFKTRGENILDLVLSNSHIVSNVRPSLPFADHTSISFSLGIPSPPPREFIPSRLYHLADWNSINYHISSHDWTLALSFLDVDNAFSYFTEVVNSLLDAFVPKSTPSPFSHYPRHLKIFYGKSKRATSIARNSVLALTLTKRFERALRAHQVKIESRIVNTRLKACKSAPPGIIDVDDTQLLSCRDKASAFSKYFASVSTSPLQSPLPSHSPPLNTPLFDLPFISISQILIAISSLAPKCNLSPDSLPNKFYSKCKFSVVSPLSIIFNKTLLTNSIPDIWKIAIVKPIPKTSSNSINSFRPISLTCSVTKIFEKILISEINGYLNGNNLLDPNQSGFRTKCTVVHYGSLSPRNLYTINGIPLSSSPFIKDLGIIMNTSLKFTDHISRMVSKARAKIKSCSNVSSLLTPTCTIALLPLSSDHFSNMVLLFGLPTP